jgi:hypothetical protein
MKFKLSLDWLLIFVPITLVLRFVPALANPTALFICSAIAIVPVAGWIGRATKALAARAPTAYAGEKIFCTTSGRVFVAISNFSEPRLATNRTPSRRRNKPSAPAPAAVARSCATSIT